MRLEKMKSAENFASTALDGGMRRTKDVVIDGPGGGGNIPLLPEYVEGSSKDEVVLRNFRGDRYVYRQPREEARVAHDPEYFLQPTFELKKGRKRTAKPRRKSA
jgi:hypothetical protein